MGEFSKIDLSGDKLDGLTKRLDPHCAATDCTECLIGTLATDLIAARARIAQLEAAEKRDVADEVQTEADWKQERERMQGLLREVMQLSGGWREAVVELEDHCSNPVRLKNMVAAADQIDGMMIKIRGSGSV